MKVFVTGHKGYIGPHLVALLKNAGHTVTGCDIGLFGEATVDTVVLPDVELLKDFRDLTPDELEGHDCIMHLAAISNDPMGDLNTGITYQINREGSINLARLSKKVGINKFFFSSSCSIYGKGGEEEVNESAPVNPLSAYAISKIDVEKELADMAGNDFCPVFLRNATAYGYSPVFRIDLVVNNLLACAFSRGDIRIKSDGQPWRPLIHCKDIARAFVAMLDADDAAVRAMPVNIGANAENYRVKDIAALVQEMIPSASFVFTGEIGNDPRDYRVNFDRLYGILPQFKLEYTLRAGMEELFEKLKTMHFSQKDFEGDRFTRLKLLKKHLAKIDTVNEIQ